MRFENRSVGTGHLRYYAWLFMFRLVLCSMVLVLRVGETIAFALMTKTGGERGFATSVVLKLGMALTW